MRWKACHDGESLYLGLVCPDATDRPEASGLRGYARVELEAERLRPPIILYAGPGWVHGQKQDDPLHHLPAAAPPWQAAHHVDAQGWSCALRLPIDWLRSGLRHRLAPLRLDVLRILPSPNPADNEIVNWLPRVQMEVSWVARQPVQGRLCWGTRNPATDFGWVTLS